MNNLSEDALTSTRATLDKKSLKIAFLENENRNLAQMAEDLQTTLMINKNIIKSLLQDQKTKSGNGNYEYTIS